MTLTDKYITTCTTCTATEYFSLNPSQKSSSLYCIADDCNSYYAPVQIKYELQPKICKCCGGLMTGLTCKYCGAEYIYKEVKE